MTHTSGPASAALPRPPELVFFDVGDTIIRIHPSWTAVYLEVCRSWEVPIEEPTLAKAFAQALSEGMWDTDGPFEATEEGSYQRIKRFDERALELAGVRDLPDEFYRALGRHFQRSAAWHVFADVHPVLESLGRAGIRRAVISNWVWALPELLHDMHLAHHFEVIVGSARVGYQKPQREIFEHALRVTGVAPSRAVHVGDNPQADVAGARSAGLHAVLVDRAGRYEAGVPGFPDVPVIGDLAALLPVLGLAASVSADGATLPGDPATEAGAARGRREAAEADAR